MASALTQLGRYRITGELGRGAMGVVYCAEDPLLSRIVAIKTITMSPDAADRADYEARFHLEAKAAGGINHPNVITIHDIGREGDIAYMAMELLEGIDLRELMKRGRMPLPRALAILAQVADGLAFAHERGVIHRDIKPANIMIVHDHHAKIMDFGIARMRVSDVQTQAGAILGSPKYMSPEQVLGKRADHRADLFSLGIVLYELAAGAAPFASADLTALMQQIATQAELPPSSIDPSVPPMLDFIVAKALRKDPGERYQTAAELAADLRACAAGLHDVPAANIESTMVLLDGADDAAKIIPVDQATIPLEQAKTTPLAGQSATVARTRSSDAGSPLSVSRQFDSSSALERLHRLSAAMSTSETGGPAASRGGAALVLERLWQDPALRNAGLAIVGATVIALIIALL